MKAKECQFKVNARNQNDLPVYSIVVRLEVFYFSIRKLHDLSLGAGNLGWRE